MIDSLGANDSDPIGSVNNELVKVEYITEASPNGRCFFSMNYLMNEFFLLMVRRFFKPPTSTAVAAKWIDLL